MLYELNRVPRSTTSSSSGCRDTALPSEESGRATTPIDRDGVHVAALIHDPMLKDEPELLQAVTAAAAIAIENARLHVELRARLENSPARARV